MNKILLVDDDRELTSLLKELLDMEGFNVLVAHDGEQALSLLDDSIDLLLLDVMMPKKNGIDTLKELRQTHQTPVIMLTARGSELDRVLGLELGVVRRPRRIAAVDDDNDIPDLRGQRRAELIRLVANPWHWFAVGLVVVVNVSRHLQLDIHQLGLEPAFADDVLAAKMLVRGGDPRRSE